MGYRVDWPDAEYHEIIPNLFMGGHLWAEGESPRHGKHSSVSSDTSWDYVVSAYIDLINENLAHLPQCDTRFILFSDSEKELSEDVWERIQSAVDQVVIRWRLGQKVLVRCNAGYNRSGLLMSLILMRLGFSAESAVRIIRKRRGRSALINPAFERYVHEREAEFLDLGSFAETEAIIGDWIKNCD